MAKTPKKITVEVDVVVRNTYSEIGSSMPGQDWYVDGQVFHEVGRGVAADGVTTLVYVEKVASDG